MTAMRRGTIWLRLIGIMLLLSGCDRIKEALGQSERGEPTTKAATPITPPPSPQPSQRPPVDEAQVLAWVYDEPVLIKDFQQHRDNAIALAQQALQNSPNAEELKQNIANEVKSPETKQRLLEQLVRDELLYADALARNLDQEADVRAVLHEFQRNVLLQKARQRILQESAVDTAAVAQFYEANKAYFKEPDRVTLRVIVVAQEQEAKNLMAQLYGGADMAELARQHSLHASKEQGGEWGPIIRAQDAQLQQQQGVAPSGQTVFEALETLVFSEGLAEGSYTAPVHGPDGRWWIAMVTSKEQGRQKQLVEVQDAITEWLKSQAYQQALDGYVNDLEQRARAEGHLKLFESKLDQVQ